VQIQNAIEKAQERIAKSVAQKARESAEIIDVTRNIKSVMPL